MVLLQLPIPQPPGAESRTENIPLASGYLKQAAYQAGLIGADATSADRSASVTTSATVVTSATVATKNVATVDSTDVPNVGTENAVKAEYDFEIEIVQPNDVEYRLCDAGVVAAIRRRAPQIVGFSCFLWNIDRTLELAKRLKAQCPELTILLGGPEITTDNERILRTESVDFLCIGEGEETFVRFLKWYRSHVAVNENVATDPKTRDALAIPGGIFPPCSLAEVTSRWTPTLEPVQLGGLTSPYRSGILTCGPDVPLFLETMRGCRYRCRFCYYPKGFAKQSYLPLEEVDRMVAWACERGVREIVLLDPTLNQRPDFIDFLQIFARHNRIERSADGCVSRRFSLFGELRAESVTPEIAQLLAAAGFYEVEVGLQTVDPMAQRLAGRHVDLLKLKTGCQTLRHAGIDVRIDLILGLPGDTVESIRRGFDQLESMRTYWTSVQIFHLSVLPGTDFHRHATTLGLRFQPRPPYTILETQTLTTQNLIDLFHEAEERFGITFDLPPLPTLPRCLTQMSFDSPFVVNQNTLTQHRNTLAENTDVRSEVVSSEVVVDLDDSLCFTTMPTASHVLPDVTHRAGHLSLVFQSHDFSQADIVSKMQRIIRQVLIDSPHTSCEIFLVPAANWERLTPQMLQTLLATCYETTSYLDFFYALSSSPLSGAKRLVVVLPLAMRTRLGLDWIDSLGEMAFILWTGHDSPRPTLEELAPFEILADE